MGVVIIIDKYPAIRTKALSLVFVEGIIPESSISIIHCRLQSRGRELHRSLIAFGQEVATILGIVILKMHITARLIRP